MRRPLCLFGLAFVAVLLLGICLFPQEAKSYEALDREQLTVLGVVEWKETKISQEEKILVVSLGQVIVLKPGQTAASKRFLKDSETVHSQKIWENTAGQIRSFDEAKKENIRLSGAEGLEGVLCYMSDEEAPAMGSVVLLTGKFYAFSHATNPGQFDAADHYRILGQQGRLMRAQCLAASKDYSVFREGLYRCRSYLALLLRASYPEKEAAVMEAMLLGEKGGLDKELKSLYQQNGIVHILAISGLHLSILGLGVHGILKRLRVPLAVDIILSVGLMYCYGCMTGMGVSLVRALVMFALKLGADLFGRTYDLLTAMMCAALILLVQQPLYLTHSGFLFSFGAVCGIGLLPSLSGCIPSGKKQVKALFTGVWVALCTLPVYLCFYYEFPPYSVLLNLLVIPCMGVVLLSGIAAMASAAVFIPLGPLAAFPGRCVLAFYEKCCAFCMDLPGRQWIVGRPEGWQIAAFLGLMASAVFLASKKRRVQFYIFLASAVLLLTLRFPTGLEITLLDVGQGDCIYLARGRHRHYLIDGGSSDQKDVDEYRIVPFLKYKGVSGLDAVFITHPDSDHENGIRGMLEDYEKNGIRIGTLVLPDVAEESKNENYLFLEKLAKDKGVPVRFLHAGQRIGDGKLLLTCLHPQAGYVCEDANAYSTVLSLTYGDFSALFTGDLEGEGEIMVIERLRQMRDAAGGCLPSRFTLLKVAHHGSKNSTPQAFLELVKPQIALISAGRDNSYGHPHAETMERLAGQGCFLYQTPGSGAVTIHVRGGKVYVKEYRKRQ